ncbi:MAG: hypothetical protein MIO92_08970 [Methanosarcinaceae archaeon]|nr:hypothetical protein [Methanosarcinaceae archaeon]
MSIEIDYLKEMQHMPKKALAYIASTAKDIDGTDVLTIPVKEYIGLYRRIRILEERKKKR